MTHSTTAFDLLSACSLFSSVDSDTRKKISRKPLVHNLPKGKIIFLHEQKADYFYVIKSGLVKLFRETLGGDQAVINIVTATHTFGETSIFNNDVYPYSAQIVEDSQLLQIPVSFLKAELEENPGFAASMMHFLACHHRQQDKEIEHLTLQNASQRIGCFLLHLISQANTETTQIQLPYDKALIAARLGMKPETFSRALAKLKQETNVEIKGATVEIGSLNVLTSYTCSACSSEFPCKAQKRAGPGVATQSSRRQSCLDVRSTR